MFNQSVSAVALEKSMGASWQRMQTIAHNISNNDTPNFKAKRVSFESELRQQMSTIEAKGVSRREAVERIENLSPRLYELEGLTGRADGNNVNIQNEQIELARVQIQYQALAQKLNGHYTMLKYAVTGGR